MTIADALDGARQRLAAAGVPDPRLEARILVSHALGVTMETVMGYPERPVADPWRLRLDAAVNRRVKREPMAYILGRREFWSLPFRVTPDTLVPRPDTETLVEAALDWVGERETAIRILDLGTGSGCMLLALLAELTAAWGVGVDASMGALEVARENAATLGLADRAHFVRSDWANGIEGAFDMVVANPPYIADPEFAVLAPEVCRFEPRSALSGGPDGLVAYRAIVPQLSRLLAPGGAAFLEVAADSAANVTKLLQNHGLQGIEIKCDLSGIPRCIRVVATI